MACILLQGVLCKSNQVTKDPDVTKKPGILPSYLHYFNQPDNSILGWVIQGAAQTKIGYPNVKALKQLRKQGSFRLCDTTIFAAGDHVAAVFNNF